VLDIDGKEDEKRVGCPSITSLKDVFSHIVFCRIKIL